MDKPRAISHFLYYLEHHPALADLDSAQILLGHTADYQALTGAIAEQARRTFTLQVQRPTSGPGK